MSIRSWRVKTQDRQEYRIVGEAEAHIVFQYQTDDDDDDDSDELA